MGGRRNARSISSITTIRRRVLQLWSVRLAGTLPSWPDLLHGDRRRVGECPWNWPYLGKHLWRSCASVALICVSIRPKTVRKSSGEQLDEHFYCPPNSSAV